MAKLNFPPVDTPDGDPTDGMIWTSPEGRQWIYRAEIPGWRSLAATGNSNIIYRGGIDLTEDPDVQYNDIVSGNQFAVSVGARPVLDAYYPGLGGESIDPGQIVVFDGNQWQYINNTPYATESVAGIVELATEAEAIAGTNPVVAMTPLRVQQAIPQATTARAGKTRYATQVEAEAGEEASAAVTPASLANLLQNLQDAVAAVVPTGMVMWWTTQNDTPAGWIECNGATISSTGATANLYNYLINIGNPWGSGGTVKVPDLRGRFVRGFDNGAGRDPDNTVFGGAQGDTFKSHTHSYTDPGHDHRIRGRKMSGQIANVDHILIDNNIAINAVEDTSTFKENIKITIKNTGGLETRPKNINLTPVIKL